MVSYPLDTYNYDRGAFCNCYRSMVAVTAETERKGKTPKIKRKRLFFIWFADS